MILVYIKADYIKASDYIKVHDFLHIELELWDWYKYVCEWEEAVFIRD